jgi:Ca-activated chloride channel family protein
MRKRCTIGIILINLCVFAAVSSASFAATEAKKNVKEANRLYQKEKLDEALQKYSEASVSLPDSDIVNFNIGTVLYKKEDYKKAIDSFTKALTSDNKKLEADALYNLGNCKYKLGKLKENTDLSTTVVLLRESLDYYKRAIDLDQKNTEARFNHEFVERELKVLLDKLKQQEEKQGSCPTGKESFDSAYDKQEKEESAQTQEQQQQEKESQTEASQQQERQQEEVQATKEESQQEEQGKELSEEGARAILERYGQEEAAPDYMDRPTRGYDREVLKDW